jgi:hypothetical protein
VGPPVAVPVADPVPVVPFVDELPFDELPVAVPSVVVPEELCWPGLVELLGVVDVALPAD